jgi:hypothetical protein
MNAINAHHDDKMKNLEQKINGKIDYVCCDLEKQIEHVEQKIYIDREKIVEMDKKILQVQKSTKTLFKLFERSHNWLRSKSHAYYDWHLNPYASTIHWVTLAVIFLITLFLTGYQLGFFGGHKPASMAAAGIPKMINYQGKLTDLNNIPKPDGPYDMKFSIYDSLTGGSRLWTCAGTTGSPTAVSVAVTNGIFSAMLGVGGDCTNALDLDFNTDAYYLGVTVGTDSEMADRKRIGAVGYAYNSDTVDGKHETDFALLTGRSGGQTLIGGTAANDDLTLEGTSNGTKTTSYVILQPTAGLVGIGSTAPSTLLQLGTSGTIAGVLSMAGGTSGLITLQTAAEAGTWSLTLPTSAGTDGYVLKTDGSGVTAWVEQTGGAGYWTDGGNYLYPTAYESIRAYDSGGTDYIDIAHDGTDAIISFANTTALNINIGVIDLSAQTVDVTLNSAVDALNFDSNTLSIDASNNRVGIGTASPFQTLEVIGTGKFSSDNINSFQVSKADGTYVMNVDTTNSYVGIGDGTNVDYFNNTGSDQNFVVPTGVTSITVKVWGAGGGGGANSSPGGGGGYATATLDVTPGETLTIMVGTGGQYRSGGAGRGPTVYGGGGNTGVNGYGGQGGGRSAIKRSSTELITAGGGGGAGWDISGDWGGGGGGSVGQDANNGANGGKGGTQSAGGAGGGSAEAGSAYQGGTCTDGDGGGGGGGGGGYYGGGAGTGGGNGGGGGGGSAFVPAGGSTLSGSGATPGNNSDSDRGTAATGGPVGTNGYSGRVVISYAGGLAKNTLDVFGSIAAGSYAGINTSPNNGLVISGNVGIGTYSPSTLLQLGTAGSTAGVLSMAGGTSGLITLQTAAAAGTWTMTLPSSAGTNGYVLQTDGSGITSWVALSANAWTDGGTYLYPTNRESVRVYDSGGTDYIDIAHNGTDALMTFANTGLLNIDSNTLVVDVANNRVGIGAASPAATLDIATTNTAYDTTARVARITNSNASGQSPFDYYINGTLRARTRADYGGNFTLMANGGYFSFLSGGDSGVGTEVVRILANGNFGIGTTSPSTLLQLGNSGTKKGVMSFAGNTSGLVTVQPAAVAGTWSLTLPASAGTNGYLLQTDGSGITSWVANTSSGWTDDGTVVRLTTSTDSVGIGTTGPDRKLDILDASNPQIRLTQADNSIYTEFLSDSNGILGIRPTGGITKIHSDGSGADNDWFQVQVGVNTSATELSAWHDGTKTGRIGLYTSSPSRILDIYDSTNPQYRITQSTDTNYAEFLIDSNGIYHVRSSGGITRFYSDGNEWDNDWLQVQTGINTSNITLTAYHDGSASGQIGIHSTDPDRRLDVLDSDYPQLRLTRTDGTVYTDFETSSSGNLVVTPSNSSTPAIRLNLGGSDYLDIVGNNDNTGNFGLMPYRDDSLVGKVGIGTTSPSAMFSVGSSSQFQVDSSGNIIKIRNVTYSWPSSQGAANTYLKNDGSGNLSWASDMITSSYAGECTASTTTPGGSAECTITDAKYLMISGFDSGADAQHTCAVHFQGNVGGTAHGYAWLGGGGTVSSCTFIGFK